MAKAGVRFGAVIKGVDRFILKGVPVVAWATIATEVAAWKRRDLSNEPNLKVRTGTLRDSIVARAVKKRNADARQWKVLPDGTRNRAQDRVQIGRKSRGAVLVAKNVFGAARQKKNKFTKTKRKTLRNYDLMFYQVKHQAKKFMALSESQRSKIKLLAVKGLARAIRGGEVHLDKRGRITKI